MAIRNPIEWAVDQLRNAGTAVESAGHDVGQTLGDTRALLPVRQIAIDDLKDVLGKGLEDFGARRTDVMFLCIIYPVIGLVLARVTSGYDMLPLVFPLASGFALIGPFAALGLYEMSRRREQGVEVSWTDALGVFSSHSFGPIVVLGLMLLGIFALWLLVAAGIYDLTLGPEPPASVGSFVRDVFTTGAGWTMIFVGVGIGFLFAVLVLAIGVISFPLDS